MFNLNDILNSAQGGDAVANLAQQFGLSTQQTQAAINALMPALSSGLQHNAQDHNGLGDILGHMNNEQHQAAFEDPTAAQTDETVGAGQDILGQLFGNSTAASQQIALHAAQVSGVSSSILQQMLPVIASMVMGGLMKSMQTQGLGGIIGQLTQMAGQGGLGGMLGQMLGQGGQQPQAGAAPSTQGGGLGGMLGNVLGGMLGGAGQSGQTGGLGGVLGNMLGGGAGSHAPQPGAPPQGQPAGFPGGIDPAMVQTGLDALSKMFNHGTKTAESHQAGLQDILGQFLQPRR